MRPNFTLSLSFSGIQLLHRQANGWGRVGDVDLSTEDLAGDLTALRAKADALGGGSVETKVIIPDEQIKYLSVDATGLDQAELQTAVLDALDGATPYAVNELEYDFANVNGSVQIAAVAKETLQEAEAFATEHGFTPLGFVAAPTAEKFPKEPNFGQSSLAKSQGRPALVTDNAPAIATGDAIPVPPKAVVPEPVPEVVEQAAVPTPGFSSRRAVPEPEAPVRAPIVPPVATPPQPAPSLNGAVRQKDVSPVPNTEPVVPTTAPPVSANAPQITGRSQAALDEQDINANLGALRPGAAADTSALDDVPPMPSGFAAAPRPAALNGAADGAPMADLRAPVAKQIPATKTIDTPNRSSEAAAKAAALAGTIGSATLAGGRAVFAKALTRKPKPEAVAEPDVQADVASPQEDEKQRMTVFGARKPKKKAAPIPVGGKPRFLGLILTAILLLFLVSVAAWASVFLDDGLARFFGGGERNRAIAELPNPNAEPEAEELIELASLETGVDDILVEDLPADQSGLTQVRPEPTIISPEEAAAKYAATGIWLATPPQPQNPANIALDDVYPASIDARINGRDAFALAPLKTSRDVLPNGIAAPATSDENFAFDDNGLVIPTPEGALTPEGVLVFLGRPARVPPAIPERLRQARLAAAENPASITNDEDTLVAVLRPRARPNGLVESTERTQLGGKTRAELAKVRPKLRPVLEKEVAEVEAAEAPATRLAVASSRKPNARPRNFARTVNRAQQQAARQQQETTATTVAAVAPRTVTPKIPSSSSVAKAATVKNAINLSRVNLIGVYGKPSSRRALVRLSSGRYKKVKVGDRVDGGRVAAIGEGQLVYTKSGRNVTLRMPKG
ncbi:hypothetical protein [Planktotalea sp.]|uniref:hypothetical protein n=1 Tax=Planktotalea sp. TaxID=2029877 RepID=UPI003297CD8D